MRAVGDGDAEGEVEGGGAEAPRLHRGLIKGLPHCCKSWEGPANEGGCDGDDGAWGAGGAEDDRWVAITAAEDDRWVAITAAGPSIAKRVERK